jgi:hypothetical protein
MKNFIIVSTICLTLLPSCYTLRQMPVAFEPVVKTNDVNGTKDELYLKSNRWMVSIFKDARSIIQYSDKAEGTIIGRYLLKDFPADPFHIEKFIYATIEITVKDGKSRIVITPEGWTVTTRYNDKGEPKKIVEPKERYYTKEMAIADINALCESFHKSLENNSLTF